MIKQLKKLATILVEKNLFTIIGHCLPTWRPWNYNRPDKFEHIIQNEGISYTENIFHTIQTARNWDFMQYVLVNLVC